MRLSKIIGKIVATPLRVVDLPFKVCRKIVDDPESERGVFADLAKVVEESIEEVVEGR